MFTLIVFIGGFFLGRYWPEVNKFIKNKLDQSNSANGEVRRMNDDDR